MKKLGVLLVLAFVVLPMAAFLFLGGPGLWRGELWYGLTAQSA